ncbi:1-acyl-sn-glycerol-3-phosphate acyltransferase [Trichodelitschia bisporula]|uniref:1-acyl-sn-glycerol-3-phosphate acyltransferase n=1 Tax=Trichodelitschia bisporula TaxID=703511 RepID=A0A6G1HQU6_9PEZI|nr:1-acyl-sn-glycerol-3-phosphate acyltransferase [Trichodelitschia bisporula]
MVLLTSILYGLLALPLVLHLSAALLSATPFRQHAHYPTFLARCLTYLLCLATSAIYGMLASLILRAFGEGGLGQWTTARFFKYLMGITSGVWVEVLPSGAEGLTRRPAVFVGNHQTELDVLFLGAMFPRYCSVTAKDSLKYTPLLGQFMSLSKTVFINRTNRASALAAFSSAAATMHSAQQSVFIFPEGTRSYATTPTLLPFKKGAFHLAVQAQVPVVPVVCANYSHVLSFKRWVFGAGTIPVRVLEPIETTGLGAGDVDELVERCRTAMEKALVELEGVKGDVLGGKKVV